MLKSIFTILIILHGLIHLLGFVKAYGYADITALTRDISKPMGIIWLIAMALLVITAMLFMRKNDTWVYFSIVGVIVSQAMIFMYWQDAKFGTIVNVLMLIVVVFGFFHLNFKSKYKTEVAAALAKTSDIPPSSLTEDDIQHLPALVQKYLHYTQAVGKPKIHNFKVALTGKIRSYETKDWMPLTSEQYNFIPLTTRLFFLDATKKMLPVSGLHSFKEGSAFMDIRLLSMYKVQYMEGKEMDISETVTFFNDLCCMAPGALIDERIRWMETEGNKVKATFTSNGITISAWLHFNEKGELINFISEDRYAAHEDGTITQLKWSTPLRDYKEIHGYRLASYAEAIYTYPDGDFTYATFTIKDIAKNVTR